MRDQEEGGELDSHEELDIFADPGEMKRRKVSWTLTKKLDIFADPGEMKRSEVSWTLTKKCWRRASYPLLSHPVFVEG